MMVKREILLVSSAAFIHPKTQQYRPVAGFCRDALRELTAFARPLAGLWGPKSTGQIASSFLWLRHKPIKHSCSSSITDDRSFLAEMLNDSRSKHQR